MGVEGVWLDGGLEGESSLCPPIFQIFPQVFSFWMIANITIIKMQHKILSFHNWLQTRQSLAGQRVRGLDSRTLQVWPQKSSSRKFVNILYASRKFANILYDKKSDEGSNSVCMRPENWKFEWTLEADNYGLKPLNLKNYNIFGMLWTSVLTWYHPI